MGAQDSLYVGGGQITHFERKLLGGGIASQLLGEHPLGTQDAGDRFEQMHGDADGARLLGDRPVDRLADPPGGIGAELETAPRVELADRTQKSHVALLDQVEEVDAASQIALGHADHQPQIGVDQGVIGVHGALVSRIQLVLELMVGGQVAVQGPLVGKAVSMVDVFQQPACIV